MTTDPNLEGLFERRERRIGKPLRPGVRSAAAPLVAEDTRDDAGEAAAPAADSQSALSPAPQPVVVASADPASAARRGASRPGESSTTPSVEPEPVGRYSIFLTREQVRWLKALRGRLLVEGREVSASQIVRLALQRLREANLDDDELHRIAEEEGQHVRGRGRPRTERA